MGGGAGRLFWNICYFLKRINLKGLLYLCVQCVSHVANQEFGILWLSQIICSENHLRPEIFTTSSRYCLLHGKTLHYITKWFKLRLNSDISFVVWRFVSPSVSKGGGMALSPQINNAEITRIFIATFTEIRLLPVSCVFIYWHKCLISENILYL